MILGTVFSNRRVYNLMQRYCNKQNHSNTSSYNTLKIVKLIRTQLFNFFVSCLIYLPIIYIIGYIEALYSYSKQRLIAVWLLIFLLLYALATIYFFIYRFNFIKLYCADIAKKSSNFLYANFFDKHTLNYLSQNNKALMTFDSIDDIKNKKLIDAQMEKYHQKFMDKQYQQLQANDIIKLYCPRDVDLAIISPELIMCFMYDNKHLLKLCGIFSPVDDLLFDKNKFLNTHNFKEIRLFN